MLIRIKEISVLNLLRTLILLLTVTILPVGTEAAVLLGRVVDHDTGNPLEGVNLEIVELKRGGQTGPKGHFRIENLNPGLSRSKRRASDTRLQQSGSPWTRTRPGSTSS